jgi:8-oxo-dGTP pyrophosphatase MutT (NUDIX family)
MEIRIEDLLAAIALDPFDDRAARRRMAHTHRHDYPDPPEYRDSCVLLLLYPGPDGLTLALTRRSEAVEHHRRQISLPGGAREGREPLERTALRETEEELGIPADGVRILGRLAPFHIPVSAFVVHPFVGVMDDRPEFRPDPREVAGVKEVPLALLLDEQNVGEQDWEVLGKPARVPFFRLPNTRHPPLWGATAMILSGFLARLRAVVQSTESEDKGRETARTSGE